MEAAAEFQKILNHRGIAPVSPLYPLAHLGLARAYALSGDSAIEVLDINIHHALAVADLPTYHHDPFDRLQIAQAKIENLVLITRDKHIPKYDVEWMEA